MMKSEGVWAVVPAAGVGQRMQSDKPKQYLKLENKTVIEQTLSRLASHPRINGIVVAIAKSDNWWSELQLDLGCEFDVAEGGDTRADSVLNALQALKQLVNDDPWVLVHDAARPCLRHSDIDYMLSELSTHPVGGILGIPVNDTVKRSNDDDVILETVERERLWRASTPQMFHLNTLVEALNKAKQQGVTVTDEASAIECCGLEAKMVEGHADNIKITIPKDLALAELFLKQQRGDV